MIAAIVVLFHPDAGKVERLLKSLRGQVNRVFAIDNTPSTNCNPPAYLKAFGEQVSYVPLGENRGIAEAQNLGIERSIQGGFTHVLLLDQDSTAAPGMVEKLLDAERDLLGKGEKISAVTPQIVDERTGSRPCAVRYRWNGIEKVYRDFSATEPVRTDNFIASGSLIRTSTLQALGVMRSDLFIEHVDTEWAFRGHTAGYTSYCVPSAILVHNFGDDATRLFGKHIYIYYSDIRQYYKLRNEVHLAFLESMGWRWRAYILTRIPYHFMLYSAFSRHRVKAFRLLLRAVRDGILGRLGPLTQS